MLSGRSTGAAVSGAGSPAATIVHANSCASLSHVRISIYALTRGNPRKWLSQSVRDPPWP